MRESIKQVEAPALVVAKKYPTRPLDAEELAQIRETLAIGLELEPRIRSAGSTSRPGVLVFIHPEAPYVSVERPEGMSSMTFETLYKSFTWANRPPTLRARGDGPRFTYTLLLHLRQLRLDAWKRGVVLPDWPGVDNLGR